MTSKRFVRQAIVATLVVMTLAAKTASAQTTPQDQCMAQLANCYYWAAVQNGFWAIWAAGIDCELQFIDCLRRAIVGA